MNEQFYNEPWFLKTVMNNIKEAVTVTDLEEKIIYVNGATEELFGYTREEMIGEHPSSFNAEVNSNGIQREILKTISEGNVWREKILNKRKNGELFILSLEVKPLKDKDGKTIAFIAFQRDVTEIENAKQEIIVTKNKYAIIFESAPMGVIMTDEKGIIIECNNRIKELLGYDKNEIAGYHFCKKLHPDDCLQSKEHLKKIIEGMGLNYIEYKFIRKDGSIVDMAVNCVSLRDKNDKFVHMVCFLTNITERKKSEYKLKKLAIELRQSNFELEQFAYIASHDLQEPIRVISSYCQLLKESHYDIIDDSGKKYIDYTINATIRMRTLINDLLNFSMAGKKDQPFEDVNIFNLVKEVMVDYEMAIEDTGSRIIIENDLPVIFAIHLRIKQLLSNLISNALKFHTDKKLIIRIGCYDKGDSWLFYIKDNGIGIKPKDFDKVFGVFKRLYSRDKYPGTGIGLALCKRIVETHGGKIWIDSKPDDGTWIYFTISKNIEVDKPL